MNNCFRYFQSEFAMSCNLTIGKVFLERLDYSINELCGYEICNVTITLVGDIIFDLKNILY